MLFTFKDRTRLQEGNFAWCVDRLTSRELTTDPPDQAGWVELASSTIEIHPLIPPPTLKFPGSLLLANHGDAHLSRDSG